MALRTRTKGFDWVILSLYLSLVAIGLLMQYATYYSPTSEAFLNASDTFTNQLMWAGLSIVAFFACFIIDRKIWNTFAYPIYGSGLVLLVLVLNFWYRNKRGDIMDQDSRLLSAAFRIGQISHCIRAL